MSTNNNRKLGRIKPKSRPMALRFASYYAGAPMPPAVDYTAKARAAIDRMYVNDQLGCCVISGKAHQLGIWTGNDSDSGGLVEATDAEIVAAYRIWNPGHQDGGCNITDVLDYFTRNGLRFGGQVRKIDGYVSVNYTDPELVKAAIYLLGSLTIGFSLPQEWYDSPDDAVWDLTNSGIIGGHDICAVGYNATGVIICTWGGLRTITWRAFTSGRWIDECYAELAPAWYGNDKLAPSGFNVEALKADLEKIGGGTIPAIDPTPVPPNPPSPPVPPAPVPPVLPWYTGVLTGRIPTTFGHADVTFTGTFKPMYPQTRGALFDRIHWLGVLSELKALIADLRPLADKLQEIYVLVKQLPGLAEVPIEDALNALRELGIVS